ncbi:DNA-binding LacI/PurR family transcriptional regulator [Sphingomonas jinjuensis]|uniref:DNA-binding LacI/PurR family transcriptional regulator n=1 Tax=Sphingomonas jinjuensis TaxID=535907 RepID=A0A840FCQ7_9SPHN|nr:substrate-binding domain-containing protein [Sphingomonas jinjuensis]MBB4153347.1 DNA-binding LacI/PurR family transcriptional regulator [Sphingomonas jinjuensis]
MAAATVATAYRRGLHVPEDVTICGFDDSCIATTIYPELTTIRQPITEMSIETITQLVDLIHQFRSGKPNYRSTLMPHQLIERQSSATLL